ncbi:lamin tail domain-containing protein [Candidatus Gracilibacteria bacterium]|nr:lamin tail domain-containing protein [Candidatus Gracilibacteria bacterium]
METLRKYFAMMTLFALMMQGSVMRISTALANDGEAHVVINEIAWAGSLDGSGEEWIELYNAGGEAVNLEGWIIEDDGEDLYVIGSGTVEPHGYFLIEDGEDATSVDSDELINLSLANSGDVLKLKKPDGTVVDRVGDGESWYAGVSAFKSSMERIDPMASGDNAENWASAQFGNGAVASEGSEVLGTPGSVNSKYGGAGPHVYFDPFETIAFMGDEISLSVKIEDVEDLYAYGFEIDYVPVLVEFVSASEGLFMGSDGVATAFNVAMKDGKAGTLVVGNARLANPASGISGAGEIFELKFKVVSPESDSGDIHFSAGSFVADVNGDVPAKFTHADIAIADGEGLPNAVALLKSSLGEERFSLALDWQEDLEANGYMVRKMMPEGNYVLVGDLVEAGFVDDVGIVPFVEYKYLVSSVLNGIESEAIEVSAVETRGLAGDNDRSDLVDGRDLERLARSYAAHIGESAYESIKDSNYDGVIDGSDLIDIGANFGMSYSG